MVAQLCQKAYYSYEIEKTKLQMDRALEKAVNYEKTTEEIKQDFAIKEMALKYEVAMERRQASKVKEILETKVVALMS